jgi:RNA-binding protein 39
MKIFVGGLNELTDVSDIDLRNIFSSFGEIDMIDLPKDSMTLKPKGYCYIQFRRRSQAQAAIQAMNGFKYKGKILKVNEYNEDSRHEGYSSRNDYDEENQFNNYQSKQALREKLSRQQNLDLGVLGPNQKNSNYNSGYPHASQSEYVLLSNLFDPAQIDFKKEPHFYKDTKIDVYEECSNFGKVDDVFIDERSSGNVWVKFCNNNWQAAKAAVEGLNGRWFASRPIHAQLISEHIYEDNIRRLK